MVQNNRGVPLTAAQSKNYEEKIEENLLKVFFFNFTSLQWHTVLMEYAEETFLKSFCLLLLSYAEHVLKEVFQLFLNCTQTALKIWTNPIVLIQVWI